MSSNTIGVSNRLKIFKAKVLKLNFKCSFFSKVKTKLVLRLESEHMLSLGKALHSIINTQN